MSHHRFSPSPCALIQGTLTPLSISSFPPRTHSSALLKPPPKPSLLVSSPFAAHHVDSLEPQHPLSLPSHFVQGWRLGKSRCHRHSSRSCRRDTPVSELPVEPRPSQLKAAVRNPSLPCVLLSRFHKRCRCHRAMSFCHCREPLYYQSRRRAPPCPTLFN
jgi:hypothetical protein